MKNWTDQPKLRCFYSASEQTVTIYRMDFKITLIARARISLRLDLTLYQIRLKVLVGF